MKKILIFGCMLLSLYACDTSNTTISDTTKRDEWVAVGPMEGVDGMIANGVAQAGYVESLHQYTLSVRVNIKQASEGAYYEGWLKQEGSGERISLGKFQNPMNDVRYSLTFQDTNDWRGYKRVSVVLKEEGSSKETEVAQGVMTVR